MMWRHNFRSVMLPDMMHLRQMWNASHGSWHEPMPTCVVCQEWLDTAWTDGVATCPLCMMASHVACLSKAHSSGHFDDVTAPAVSLPHKFVHRLCLLCRTVVLPGAAADSSGELPGGRSSGSGGVGVGAVAREQEG